ncbi:MucR family transcriptional regulator [Methylobacterium sp. BTF04]|uniref:MucR family transcriptional regulator n=1 Tax=Methylobacterium sp. BTF04 TaxID=2708300 RepID=UPI0013D70B63|nr:MucR family transcriptional regulator [Methylobacterium sp. BTF04]NEU14986.1 MucR family transcriptional regulator [Methylobacterium sp. BTF04]
MDDMTSLPESDRLTLAVDLIMAYVCNNSVPASELLTLIANVHAALLGLTGGISVVAKPTEKLTPAQVKKSITADGLISFEDGKLYKTLRRHLTTRGLTPLAYREKYGLPSDYPMVSAAYSAKRSELARSLGLGKMGRGSSAGTFENLQTSDDAAPAKRRGRPLGKAKTLAAA